jgi:hypothetical protein
MNSYVNHVRSSLSYNTGAHALKAGVEMKLSGQTGYMTTPLSLANYTLVNGKPNSVTFFPGPIDMNEHVSPNLGLFAQDSWTVKRLTADVGLRFDWLRTTYPDETLPAAQYRPATASFPGGTVLNWKDLDPRLGMAYDLLGNGRTALKVSVSRYVKQEALQLTMGLNATIASQASTARSWNEPLGNYIVTGNPLNPAANGDLGPGSNKTFGTPVITTTIDPSFAKGFDVRPYQWEFLSGVQQELIPGMALTAEYVRRSYGNIQVTQNAAVSSPADWSPYCVTAPADVRLPGGGGYPLCGLFDLNPAFVGLQNNIIRSASTFGNDVQTWNGFDLVVNARLRGGMILQGGLDTGKTVTDNCAIVAQIGNPSPLFCHTETPFLSSFRMSGAYPMPWSSQISAAFQSNPGPVITASGTFTNAQIAPSLGRNLSSGSTAALALVAPGALYNVRAN